MTTDFARTASLAAAGFSFFAGLPEGGLGPHDGRGPLHLAFSFSAEDLPAWEKLLVERAIAIETRIEWPRGGRSIYFRDPDNHSVELATPGIWSIY